MKTGPWPRSAAALGSVFFVLAAIVSGQRPAQGNVTPTASVEDAIKMVRIQHESAADASVAAISPDGTRVAFVTWSGDLARNTNVYELRVVDMRLPLNARSAEVVLSKSFSGDRHDQEASPIKQLRFIRGGRALAFLGLDAAGVAQVYELDVVGGHERQLTRHPSSVRSFAMDANGRLVAFSAVAHPEDIAGRRLQEDGVHLWDQTLFPSPWPFFSASSVLLRMDSWSAVRQYFVVDGGTPRLFFDSRQSRPTEPLDLTDPDVAKSPVWSLADDRILSFGALNSDPGGARLLLYPYQVASHRLHPERYLYYTASRMNAYARRVASMVGVVDTTTGGIEPLLEAPSPQFERYESGAPLWSPDGHSVIVYTLFPNHPADPPAWVEVDLDSRNIRSLGLPKGWKPIAWSGDGRTLILDNKGTRFGSVTRLSSGLWSELTTIGATKGFNPAWSAATNGAIVIGVEDGLREAPELASYDLMSKQRGKLTDLNPALRQRHFGDILSFHWRAESGSSAVADGFLIKPTDYRPGERYPLVILLDDGTLGRDGRPYLLDAASQLSGHAIQMLAASGFMVLYAREPFSGNAAKKGEGERIREDIEAAISKLDQDGLIDRRKIGVSGWSRAGFYVDYLLIHSSIQFAAATAIDGGGSEYTDHMRPFTDEELKRIRTPLLLEPHGLWSLVYEGSMADRMMALGRPVDILYFDSASHSTTRPQHRLRSLGTHIDWWRFWLQGYVDADPAKRRQYAHWREMLDQQCKRLGGKSHSPGYCRSH